MVDAIEVMAKAAFEFDWPKDTWERLGPGYHQDRYKGMIRAANTARPNPWQPMDTAPTDGKHCILAVKDGSFIWSVQGAYFAGQWDSAIGADVKPLAWMPNVLLPDWAKPWEKAA